MTTVIKDNSMVNRPGGDDKVKFSDLSVTGGVVNTYKAVKLAEQTKGKRKMKKTKVKKIQPNRA